MKILLNMLLVVSISFSCFTHASTENVQKLGSMTVHYMAIGADFFPPEITKAYGITRSRYNGLINISVLDNAKAELPAKRVAISGEAKNNLGQFKPLEFQEVKEGEAIYYLAQVNFNHEETIHFTLYINDGKEKQVLKFSQKFYVD